MLLALDAGNTNVTIGVFEDSKLTTQWRLRTVKDQTADEWGVLLCNLFTLASLEIAKVRGIIIASVVPQLDSAMALMARRYFGAEAMYRNSAPKLNAPAAASRWKRGLRKMPTPVFCFGEQIIKEMIPLVCLLLFPVTAKSKKRRRVPRPLPLSL